MLIRPCVLLSLLCLVFLGGCAPKTVGPPPFTRFPDQPTAALARTPAQALAGARNLKGFSVSGGWGYRQTDAFVLAVPPGHGNRAYNNTVPLELYLIRKRNEVEFSGTPPEGQRYAVVDYGTDSRTLGMRNGRMYAHWRGQVRLLSERESPALYREASGRSLARRASSAPTFRTRSVPREYWFDITETFNLKGGSAARSLPGQQGAGTGWKHSGKF